MVKPVRGVGEVGDEHVVAERGARLGQARLQRGIAVAPEDPGRHAHAAARAARREPQRAIPREHRRQGARLRPGSLVDAQFLVGEGPGPAAPRERGAQEGVIGRTEREFREPGHWNAAT